MHFPENPSHFPEYQASARSMVRTRRRGRMFGARGLAEETTVMIIGWNLSPRQGGRAACVCKGFRACVDRTWRRRFLSHIVTHGVQLDWI